MIELNEILVIAQVPAVVYALFGIAMFVTAVFLILLVLVQRGRGGGLAGAFGGMGGQSAFGAKAGDTFTKVTIYASTFWILLCMAALAVLNPKPDESAAPPPGINNPAGMSVDGAAEDGATEDGSEEATDSSENGADSAESGDGEANE